MTGRHLSDLFSGRTGGTLLMPWARIDDAFDDHPKVLALLDNDQGGAAVGLWTLCLTWAHRNTRKKGKIPGRLPASLPRRYLGPPARELAALLVNEELWEARDDGWQIHDFDQYLPTEETSAARAAAGRKGAEARWAKRAGRDGNLPSSDGKPMAADGSRHDKSADPADTGGSSQDEPPADGNEPSADSKLPFGDGKAMASDGSRAPARRAISNEIAPSPGPIPVPPTAGAEAPGDDLNPAPVVAAFIDGATSAGLKRPAAPLIARVGKQARQILSEGTYSLGELLASAARMGAGEWNDLAVQLRKDDAAAAGRGGVMDRRQQATDQKFNRAMERARARDAQEAGQ